MFYSFYYLIVYFADPLFIVSSEKDYKQENIQAILSRSRLVGLIHPLRQSSQTEPFSLANCTDKIDLTDLHWILYCAEITLP